MLRIVSFLKPGEPRSDPLSGPQRARSESTTGFTLVEVMMSALVLMVVSSAVLTLLYQSQERFQSEGRINQSSNQVRLAMDQIVRSIRHAGNAPKGYLETNGIPPIEILDSTQIRVNSDPTGSVDSVTANVSESTGDPDGALDSIYERTTYRYDAQASTLYVNVGYGETVLVSSLSGFSLTFYDELGELTTSESEIARVDIWMVASVELPSEGTRVIPLNSEVFIRSKSLSLGGGD